MNKLAVATMLMTLAVGARPAAACTADQIKQIANYYWTVKPLCRTQSSVLCASQISIDPKTPCRLSSTCAKYVLLCASNPPTNLLPRYAVEWPWQTSPPR